MKRLKFLDISKGIAIILVVFGHFMPEGAPQWYVFLRQVIYSFHMPLFLFISGFVYVYTMSDTTYVSFLLKKFKRIVLPYFIVSFLFILLKAAPQLLGIYVKNPVTVASVLKVFYTPEAAVSLWYLWVLWWLYMLMPLMKTRKTHILLLLISLVFSYMPVQIPDVFALPKLKEMTPYFMFGVVAADWRTCLERFKGIHSIVWVLLFLSLVAIWKLSGVRISVALALTGTIMILSLSYAIVPLIERGCLKWLEAVSDASYSIYLFHPMFIAGALAFIHETGIVLDNGAVYAAISVVTLVIAVVGPMFIRSLLVRWGVRNFS